MTPFRTHMSSQVLAVVIYTELISLENRMIQNALAAQENITAVVLSVRPTAKLCNRMI